MNSAARRADVCMLFLLTISLGRYATGVAQKGKRAEFIPEGRRCQPVSRTLSYHIRNVRAFSTIEVSPGCGFTMPRKRLVFSSPASLVSKDDGQLAVVDEFAEGSGMGVRGKGQRPFLCSSL